MSSGIISVLAFWLFFFFICPMVGKILMGDEFYSYGMGGKLATSILGFLMVVVSVFLSALVYLIGTNL